MQRFIKGQLEKEVDRQIDRQIEQNIDRKIVRCSDGQVDGWMER